MAISVKKKARSINTTNLTSAQKDDLIKQLKLELSEAEVNYKKIIVEKDNIIKKLREENENLTVTNNVLVTDDVKIKSILRLYAQGKSTGRIHDILNNTESIDVSFDLIQNIIDKYETGTLDTDLRDYCFKEKELFLKENVFNDEEDRIKTIREMDNMMNAITVVFSKISKNIKENEENGAENLKELFNAVKSFGDLASTKAKFTKGILSNTDIDSIIVEMKDYSKENSAKILNFSDSNRKKVDF